MNRVFLSGRPVFGWCETQLVFILPAPFAGHCRLQRNALLNGLINQVNAGHGIHSHDGCAGVGPDRELDCQRQRLELVINDRCDSRSDDSGDNASRFWQGFVISNGGYG